MIVVDASAVLTALLNDGPARAQLSAERLHAPHLVDSEVAGGLRRPVVGLLPRVWELRDDLSACDASYVSLAEALECPLLSADGRLSRAAGVRCAVLVVPR